MSLEDVIEQLDSNDEILESYVLLREMKMYLDVGEYQPLIKIHKSSFIDGNPYHFSVSHHVHTPEQMSPYFPSRTSFSSESEREAIDQAISSTTSFLKDAINKGHDPEDEWLIANENF